MRANELDRSHQHVEPDYHVHGVRRGQSTNFPFSSTVSRSYDMSPRPAVSGQALSHELSQSRLDGQSSRIDGFAVSKRPRVVGQNPDQGSLAHGYEDHFNQLFSTFPPSRTRSPVRYAERLM